MTVVILGIVFDLIGTAAAAADIAPLNAKAARRTAGAKYSVHLAKHADQVASFCCDVIGDISGIISGTLAAVIVIRLARTFSYQDMELYMGVLLTALVAALTVGGKAWGKTIAVKHSTEVLITIGFIVTRIKKPLSWFHRE